MGRRNKDIPNQSELLVDDTDHEGGGVVMYHTMPTSSSAKKRKVAHNHGKAWPGIICSYPVTTTWIIGQVCCEALDSYRIELGGNLRLWQ